ncbi:CsbD family protein [Haloechinothrix sp. LS1_15]|uniref:CsbD family protein n=1 Tax=Haloechinothrix sp. LS1_15 TaxID=2652248 RepID=UPI002948011C|nr:CsbD family protein [Haloechinothrix sp. LS1_15]MDV6011257.1 CsbD family protein [Haloechinothrix sp. LS1_15]
MGILDKIKSKAEKATGSAKEKAGEVTGNEDLQESGKADRVSGDVAETAHELKDEAKDKAQGAVADAKDAFDDDKK